MAALRDFIKMVYESHTQIKIIGTCFGAQIVAEALGGSVQKMPVLSSEQLPGGMFIGKEQIETTEEFWSLSSVKRVLKEHIAVADQETLTAQVKDSLKLQVITATHSEFVAKLPPGASMCGSSPRGANEIWRINDRVLCIQSHPEFNVHLIKE
jgi:GMP synthase-like glutamine amidotransferase